MELGSINLVVNDSDKALNTYLKIFGSNNVREVINVKGLTDTIDIVDGYYLKTDPIMLGIFKPLKKTGRMAKHLETYGEGIHHIEFHVKQDEFVALHKEFKGYGWPVSDKPIFLGRLGEAIFWIEEEGEQGVPVKFATKANHGFNEDGAIYLDTPKRFEKTRITEEYHRPRVNLVTAVVAAKEFEKQKEIWSRILSGAKPVDIRDSYSDSTEQVQVNDGRGNIFMPVSFRFQGFSKVSIYFAMNKEGPINKVLDRRNRKAMYHNIISVATRDRFHEYWGQLEGAGFAMVDPKPLLLPSTANYFFFVHPISTHGVVSEFVSATKLDRKTGEWTFDWSDTETYIVKPDLSA